ncbi:oxidoreductase [Legionella beliardensis]|uniref:Oxidoreductase n=1 Tax=Legionella beliardensis TaxID=91822 RepID=A0A378I1B3_9GAMM|nr:NAD(P)H-binding protein [Legionella beliardensis]STX28997.1 oxidoreductase [Legionella beliardensis]
MNILITGASGFAGTWVTRELIQKGHQVVAAVRDIAYTQKLFPQAQVQACDFVKDTTVEAWLPRLAGIDVVINCVGIFYHSNPKIMWAIHFDTPKALFKAAEQSTVKQIIHLSALGVDCYQSDYATSKKAIEDYLLTLKIPAIILRPSFIYGPASEGGMALMRALAAFPGIIPLPGKGMQQFQPIHVGDLAHAISNMIEHDINEAVILAAVASTPITLKEILLTLRSWLQLARGYCLSIPLILIKLGAKLGDYLPFSTINTPAIAMLELGNVTSPAEAKKFAQTARLTPRSFTEGVYSYPSNKPDRFYARLFFIKPLLRLSLAFMWLASALVSAFFFPRVASYTLLAKVGVASSWQPFLLNSACIINALIGISLLFNYKTKLNCVLQVLVMAAYTVIITIKLPDLWLEPFGSIVKNIPVLISIIILYLMD